MTKFIPYGCQCIDEDDIKAVVEVLKSDWITTGPAVDEFEKAITEFVGVEYGVAVSSGTAALHTAMYAIGIAPGDEVIIPTMTFTATATAVVFQGGRPVFCDVDAGKLLIDPNQVEAKITPKTKAIIAVDYTGQTCQYDVLREIADKNNLVLVADACHSIGGEYKGQKVGTLADITTFSFHPVKHITTGEGGMVVTNNAKYYQRMRMFRNHGITLDQRQRCEKGQWFYEVEDVGYNYRITDIQCALGTSQLKKLPGWIKRRQEIALRYDESFKGLSEIQPLDVTPYGSHAYHLYVVRVLGADRNEVFSFLRDANIGVNVHYIPVHLHPLYRRHFGTKEGLCPVAEAAYIQILSFPIFPMMTDGDVDTVIQAVYEAMAKNT
ncbi:MAG: UDP-4-amino-4,6-dideoxy-N-acetyl-beta-L-altrosamine transaminase [Planctomycetes bacterium]|nr:UDP-4-amino-4,6-dideoxy-N-acetyl-beta-L-altrosamine transaminase [Planctomycetota bacterium]